MNRIIIYTILTQVMWWRSCDGGEVVVVTTDPLADKVATRCDYLCQNDDACRSGRCVLTQCLDTPSCFRYCFYCNYEEKCYEAGSYCYAYHSVRSNSAVTNPSSFFFASFYAIGQLLFTLLVSSLTTP
jgi:hypothetical protein